MHRFALSVRSLDGYAAGGCGGQDGRTPRQVLALAPDASAAKVGRGLASPWRTPSRRPALAVRRMRASTAARGRLSPRTRCERTGGDRRSSTKPAVSASYSTRGSLLPRTTCRRPPGRDLSRCRSCIRGRLSHKSPGAKVRRQLSRSKDFWEGSETNQSPGNGSVWAAADICDSLRRKRERRESRSGVGGRPVLVPKASAVAVGPLRDCAVPCAFDNVSRLTGPRPRASSHAGIRCGWRAWACSSSHWSTPR